MNEEGFSKDFYKNCQYDIRVYKTKNMDCSRHVMSGDNKLCILAGISSFLQSCLDTNVMSTEELKAMIDMVIEVRKTGARNKVIYNGLEEDE